MNRKIAASSAILTALGAFLPMTRASAAPAPALSGYYRADAATPDIEAAVTPLRAGAVAVTRLCSAAGWGAQVALIPSGREFAVRYRVGAGCLAPSLPAPGWRALPGIGAIRPRGQAFTFLRYGTYRRGGATHGEVTILALSDAGCGCQVNGVTILGLPVTATTTAGAAGLGTVDFDDVSVQIPADEGFWGNGPGLGYQGRLIRAGSPGVLGSGSSDGSAFTIR